MQTKEKINITVEAIIEAPIEVVWKKWTSPEDIVKWNNASDDWFTPNAENDLHIGGRFLYRMEAKDGSTGFNFGGEYINIKTNLLIAYLMDDGRKVEIDFVTNGIETIVSETFEAEHVYPVDMQRAGWQSILSNFKKYVETGRQ